LNQELEERDELEPSEDRLGLARADREGIADAIIATNDRWQSLERPLKLGDVPWQPDLIRDDDDAVCHFHLVPDLRRVWIRRITAARDAGRVAVVAAPLQYWYASETLLVLDELEVCPIVLHGDRDMGWTVKSYRSVCEMVASENFLLPASTVSKIGKRALARSTAATGSYEKGWRFEDFLCLLFSQIGYFEVHSHNFTNETEEIDVVVINRAAQSRALPISPIVLVSAKNPKDPVGVPALTDLHSKMDNRRGQCRLGFLCSADRIASTVPEHELRFSQGDQVVIMLDGEKLRHLLDAADKLDEEIENLVINASLK
jgi:hypothetical protein